MELIGLRYFNVYGKRQDPLGAYAAAIPKFINSLIKLEQPTINGDGSFSRDFTYVEDVVQINQLAALTQNPNAINQIYNVAAGERNTLNKLFVLLRHNLVIFNAKIKEINPIYGPIRKGDIPHSQASIDKAIKLLSYQPKYDLEMGIEKTVAWYMKIGCE